MTNQSKQSKHSQDCDCQACEAEWAEWVEAWIEAERLAVRDPERVGHAKPATDAEWNRYWDAEFPREVKHG